tara:strand:- start:387 stop:764 length:378 start_codon:yes stop_codon:yes gene_type:complete
MAKQLGKENSLVSRRINTVVNSVFKRLLENNQDINLIQTELLKNQASRIKVIINKSSKDDRLKNMVNQYLTRCLELCEVSTEGDLNSKMKSLNNYIVKIGKTDLIEKKELQIDEEKFNSFFDTKQ